MAQKVLSGISGVLFLLAFVPYLLAIWNTRTLPSGDKNKAEPAKVSWVIWASLDTITLAGMVIKRSLNGQILGAITGAWTVVGFAMKFGKSGWELKDKLYLCGAAVGIMLLFSNPTLAILASCAVVFLGAFSTFENGWKHPQKEDKLSWTIWWLSCVCAILAIPKWDLDHAAQPVTFTIIETVMMYLLWIRPRPLVTEQSSVNHTSAE